MDSGPLSHNSLNTLKPRAEWNFDVLSSVPYLSSIPAELRLTFGIIQAVLYSTPKGGYRLPTLLLRFPFGQWAVTCASLFSRQSSGSSGWNRDFAEEPEIEGRGLDVQGLGVKGLGISRQCNAFYADITYCCKSWYGMYRCPTTNRFETQ